MSHLRQPLIIGAIVIGFATTYTRDKLGRITQQLETVNGIPASFDYSYDLAGRLAAVAVNVWRNAIRAACVNSPDTFWPRPFFDGLTGTPVKEP